MKTFKKRTKGVISLLSAMTLAAVTALSTAVPAAADSSVNEDVKNAADGVYAVELVYNDKDSGKKYPIYDGTGFFINDKTLITCEHVISIASEDEDSIKSIIKELTGDYDADNLGVDIMLSSDISVTASIKKTSEIADWAILETKEAVNITPLKLADSDACQKTQEVYTLGYPGIIRQVQNDYKKSKTFTKSDITITNGKITGLTTDGDVDKIMHNSKISEGNSGGPLVDNAGNVLGVNAEGVDDYFYAISINQIKDMLDMLKIDYQVAGAAPIDNTDDDNTGVDSTPIDDSSDAVVDEPTDTPVTPATVDKSELESAVKDAEKKDLSDYTDETAKDLKNAIADAKDVIDDDAASDKDVEKAIAAIDDAVDSLEEKSALDTKMIVIIGAGAVLVILIIVIVVVVAGGKKKSATAAARPASVPPTPAPMPVQPQAPIHAPSPAPMTTPSYSAPMGNAGETTVLGAGAAGETTVLGGGASMFSLRRKSSGEMVSINKASFTLGKDNRQCDYCIAGNTSVSRVHARLDVKGGQCFITDMRSTNGTFVNGSRVSPNQEVALKSGDVIRISDEEFEFPA